MKKIYGKSILILIAILVLFIGYKFNVVEKDVTDYKISTEIENSILQDVDEKVENNSMKTVSIKDVISSNDWAKLDAPEPFGGDWKTLQDQIISWRLNSSRPGNTINAKESEWKWFRNYSYKKLYVEDGFFVSVHGFEENGGVFFYPKGDKNKKYLVYNGNIIDFFVLNDECYMIESQYAADPSNGKILKLVNHHSKWTADEVLEIGSDPYCFVIKEESIMYLVTYDKLLILSNNKITEVAVENAFWQNLYPNSIVFEGDVLYIGMRGCIAQVDLESKAVSMWKPK